MKVKHLVTGFIMATIGLSLVNGLTDLIDMAFEWVKGIFAIRITSMNQAIQDIADGLDEENNKVRAIGFMLPKEEEEEEYDEY